jgi:hypothetical protein
MLLKLGWRYYLTAISLSLLLSLASLISCTAAETPLPANHVNNNTTIPIDTTPAALLYIKSVQAKPKTIKAGETTTIAWNVTGASSMSIEPAVGPVSGNTGNISITPKETTLYTLKASDGQFETSAKFLVIVKAADGSIIWPNSSSDNITTEQIYEGWSYYPNKYIEWKITDGYKDPYGDTGNCWQVGYITNNNTQWMMTDVTINKNLVADGISPSSRKSYTTTADCNQSPQLKWKWKALK